MEARGFRPEHSSSSLSFRGPKSSDASYKAWKWLHSLFSFAWGPVPRHARQARAQQFIFKAPDAPQWQLSPQITPFGIFNNTYFPRTPEVYEGLLLVGLLGNVISHSDNVKWHSHCAVSISTLSNILSSSSITVSSWLVFARHLGGFSFKSLADRKP